MTGGELRAIRERLGLTQEAFGRALGYEGGKVNINVSQMEAGARSIPPQTAKLAEMYLRHGVPEA